LKFLPPTSQEVFVDSMQYFELFALPATFAIDARALDTAYRAQQAHTHPDKFAAAPDAQRRAAEQRSALVNDAYKTLKDPVLRAAYLIKSTYGANAFDERDTKMPADFLVAQMEIREELADICAVGTKGREDKLEALLARVEAMFQSTSQNVQSALDQKKDERAAIEHTRKLRFLQKVTSEIEEAME
jgi:molecular chaperone HscB